MSPSVDISFSQTTKFEQRPLVPRNIAGTHYSGKRAFISDTIDSVAMRQW